MASQTSIRRLERRVDSLERELAALRPNDEARRERARQLLIQHLRSHAEVEPLAFAVRHGLPPDIVESVLQEFDRKDWTVPADDETA